MSPEPDTPQHERMGLCLIAGVEASDCYPNLLRYLQLGLVDESVETLRVVLQGEPLSTLQTGTSVLLQERPLAWPLSGWSHREFVRSVTRKLEGMQRNGPLVVHAFSPSAYSFAAQIAEATQSELVFTIGSSTDVIGAAARRLMEKAALVFPADHLRESIPASLRTGRRLEHIPVGVSCAAAPATFSQPDRAPVLVFSGPLTDDSGVEILLRAARQILAKIPSLLVFVIGKGPAEESLRRLAESLQIDQSITFTGRIEDWRGVLEAADIFSAPGAGRVWREEALCALAAGVCVVASNATICEELIHEKTALLYEHGDDAALAHCLLRLLGEQDEARRLAAAGQDYVRQHNAPSQMISAHLTMYGFLTARHQTLAFNSAR